MKILIYTRPTEYASSITPRHWQAALSRNGMAALQHELIVCHDAEALAQHLSSADVIVSSKADLRKFITPAHSTIKFIFFAFAGVDHLAPFDWVPAGACVVNNSGATRRAIGEYAIFALHLLANRIVAAGTETFLSAAKQDGFVPLAERSVTIIGVGGVGGGVAEACKAFRMTVLGVCRSGRPAPNIDLMYPSTAIGTAISQSDFVVIACPVTTETRGLFDAALIARMRLGAGLINIARGAIIEEAAICDAIERGALGGAVLDVVTSAVEYGAARIRNTPGILVTPHVSGDDKAHFIDNTLDVFASNLKQHLNGETPSNAIEFELGY
jgi:glyoxylate/hydroxypyruvate reductase